MAMDSEKIENMNNFWSIVNGRQRSELAKMIRNLLITNDLGYMWFSLDCK